MLLATISESITCSETTDPSGTGTKGFIVRRTAAGLKGPPDTLDGTGREVVLDRVTGTKDKEDTSTPTCKGRVRSWSWWIDKNTPARHPDTGEPLDGYLLEDWIVDDPDPVHVNVIDPCQPGAGLAPMTHFAGCGEKDGVRDYMVWGFCRIDGRRYRAVKYYARKGDWEVRARMVYTWAGRE